MCSDDIVMILDNIHMCTYIFLMNAYISLRNCVIYGSCLVDKKCSQCTQCISDCKLDLGIPKQFPAQTPISIIRISGKCV